MRPAPESLAVALADRYVLRERIGQGGMGSVYRAEDLKHGRDVAIKVLLPAVASVVGPERFLREIEIAARLAHPHIVPLHDSGQVGEFVYFVMPYIAGGSLRELLKLEAQLPVDTAVRITCEVAGALAVAHERGTVHRDVKPENILLDSGHAVLADFGIAHALADVDEEKLTLSGASIGTPLYMSPEQAAGDVDVDARSDQYSLACVLYEMLTGDPPFRARTAQAVLARHVLDEPASIRTVRPQVSAAVEEVVLRALAKSPADRYPSAAAFATALDVAVRDGSRRLEETRTRRRLVWLSVVLAVLAGVFAWNAFSGLERELDPDKIMVFPLADRGGAQSDGGGVDFLVMAALGGTEPLRWLAGWNWLDSEQRANPAGLTQREYARISRSEGAGHYITGQLLQGPSSTNVALYLFDASGGGLVHQVSSTGSSPSASVPEIALEAIIGLLPVLVDPGREFDLDFLTERAPAAITTWLLGEREYRFSRFTSALEFYQRALDEDSAMALAAIKGAQAASWEHHADDARELVDAALGMQASLPERHGHYLRSLDAYLGGDAGGALSGIRSAIAQDSLWSEAWMLGGEIFQHLLTEGSQPDSAIRYFRRSAGDPGFTPPLLHLVDYAVREGRIDEARELQARLSEGGAGLEELQRIEAMIECVARGPSDERSLQLASIAMGVAWEAAQTLSVGAQRSACALSLYRAIFGVDAWTGPYTWGAAQGLQSLHVARGEIDEAEAVLRQSLGQGRAGAAPLFEAALNEAAGAPMPALLHDFEVGARANYGDDYERIRPDCTAAVACAPWLLGLHFAARRDSVGLATIRARVRAAARAAGTESPSLFERALGSHAVDLSGDDGAAAGSLRELLRSDTRADLFAVANYPHVSLAPERIRLAELCLEARDYQCAHDVAATLDHPTPLAFVRFAAQGLAIRREAALGMGDQERAERYASRLRALGRDDLLGSR